MLKFFSSVLDPHTLAVKLGEIVDEERIDPKSSTLYQGERPFLGSVSTDRFRIRRRAPIPWILWWLTPGRWFQPVLDGTVTKNAQGTRIEIVGGTSVWTKISWTLVLLGCVSAIGLLTVFYYPYSITHDPGHSGANLLLGIVVLNLVAGILVALPIIGWLLTRGDLRRILKELESRLALVAID